MKEVLAKIVQNHLLEAKWLNTLSLLEHMGARKINKSVGGDHPSFEILQHLQDETRHASVFKELSLFISDRQCSAYLCADEAISYFQMLDHTSSEWLTNLTGQENSYQNYLLVTCLIERRAMKIYPLYKNSTRNPQIKEKLEKIIQEENSHRYLIEKKVGELFSKNLSTLDDCLKIEENLFMTFSGSLRRELSGSWHKLP